jgi:TetR/AcrR family transcriptional regulator
VSDGAEAKREQILRSALGSFMRYGYRRTSMETIAQAAGVSRPALYQHFEGKEAVFRAGVELLLDTAAERAAQVARSSGPFEERMYAVLAVKIDLAVGTDLKAEFRGELLAEAAAIAGDLFDTYRERWTRIVESVLASADDSGEVDLAGVELTARDAADLLLTAVTGIETEHPEAATAHVRLRQLVTLVLRGLRSP